MFQSITSPLLLILFIPFICLHSSISSSLEPRVNCNRTHYGNYGYRGVVSSYNFPFDYGHNLTCVNRIFLPPSRSPQESRKVCFTFKFFSMENNSVYCSFDRLYTWDGGVVYKYCGDGLYHYGVEVKDNSLTNVWRSNFCWPLKANTTMFNLTLFTDDSVNATGFMAFYDVHSSLYNHPPSKENSKISFASPHNKFAPCTSEQWVCPVDRRCILRKALCDGNIDCEDASDESFAFARCRGRQDLTACDFSQHRGDPSKVCGMDLEGWAVINLPFEPAARNSWLPEQDHTNGTYGSYLHTSHLPALLKSSPTSLLPHLQYCLRFWYIIRKGRPAAGDVTLAVYLTEDQALLRPEWLMSSSNTRAKWHKRKRTKPPMDWDSAGWRLAEVVVEPPPKAFRVLFNARNGFSSSSSSSSSTFASAFPSSSHLRNVWQDGGVALDDVSILEGPCSGIDLQCNFESTTCGWLSHDVNYHDHTRGASHMISSHQWKLYDYKNSEIKDDHYDKSSLDGNGKFAYVVFPASSSAPSFVSKEMGLFISPPISSTYKETLCFSFWFMKSVRESCQLKLYTLSYDERLSAPLWSDRPSASSSYVDDDTLLQAGTEGESFSYGTEDDAAVENWVLTQVKITSQGPFRVILQASRQDSTDYCMVAVDAMRLDRSACKHSCLPNEFRCSDGLCVGPESRCNGLTECADASDEEECSPAFETSLSNDSTTCRAPSLLCNNGTFCLPEKWLCDGMNDCLDGLDELDCSYTKNTEDVDEMYEQELSPEGGYFTEEKEENSDGVDNEGECTDEDFHCLSNNECVSIEDVCDGVARCTDQSDETNCSEVAGYMPGGCPPFFNPCSPGSPCVSPSMLCDGKADCPNAADEEKTHCISKTGNQKQKSMSVVVGVVCAIILVLLLIICVVVFLLLSKRRLKRCQPRGRCLPPPSISSIAVIFNSPEEADACKNQQKALKKILEENNDNNNNNNDDDDCNNSNNNNNKNKQLNYKDESISFLQDVSGQKSAKQGGPNDSNRDLAYSDLDGDLSAKTDFDYRDFGFSSPSQRRKLGVFNQASRQKGFYSAANDRGSTANSVGDHIYEEPSGILSLMQPGRVYDEHLENFDESKHNSELRFSPGSSRFLSSIQQQQQLQQQLQQQQQARNTLSSVANPSATCHRISRIRLGTTALQARTDAAGWSDNRGHATMGRPSRNQQTSFLDSRRKSGVDIMANSPTSPAPVSTDLFTDMTNVSAGIARDEVLMMMARDTSNGLVGSSKSSTPADSSNSSNSATSNTHLLPNNNLAQPSNNTFLPQHNKFKKDHRILPGIGYSSECMQQFDMQQMPYNKHNNPLFNKNIFQQKQMTPIPSNNQANNNGASYNTTTLQKQQQLQQLQTHLQQQQLQLKQMQQQRQQTKDSDSAFVPQIYTAQQAKQKLACGDELLNPTCV